MERPVLRDARHAAFADALLGSGVASPALLHPSRRFSIYRNNYFAGLGSLLAARFPVVKRLVGEDCFRACAYRYCQETPPVSPMLYEYGASFAEFLGRQAELSLLPYLPDIARLEWERHVSLNSADASALPSDLLTKVLLANGDGAMLAFHPSVRLVRSEFPIQSIWLTNSFDPVVNRIEADAAGESVLIWRKGDRVEQTALSAAEFEFTEALMKGADLGRAADKACALENGFDATPLFARFVGDALIVGCEPTTRETQGAQCFCNR